MRPKFASTVRKKSVSKRPQSASSFTEKAIAGIWPGVRWGELLSQSANAPPALLQRALRPRSAIVAPNAKKESKTVKELKWMDDRKVITGRECRKMRENYATDLRAGVRSAGGSRHETALRIAHIDHRVTSKRLSTSVHKSHSIAFSDV